MRAKTLLWASRIFRAIGIGLVLAVLGAIAAAYIGSHYVLSSHFTPLTPSTDTAATQYKSSPDKNREWIRLSAIRILVMRGVEDEFKDHPELVGAKVQSLDVVQKFGNEYTGLMKVLVHDVTYVVFLDITADETADKILYRATRVRPSSDART